MVSISDPNGITVFLGRTSQMGPNPNEVSRNISQVHCHPWYDPSTFDNDICLLKLSAPVNFTQYIAPVCLAAANSIILSRGRSWVTGWGKADNGKAHTREASRAIPIPFKVVYFLLIFPVEIRNFPRHPPGGGGAHSGKQPVPMHLP